MENKKQEAIKKAYGEYWEKVKEYVDEEGWVTAEYFPHSSKIDVEFGEDFGDSCSDFCIRPKSLQGIETNNGWISVNDRLPEIKLTIESFWVFYVNYKGEKAVERMIFFKDINRFEVPTVTHWQPIQVPPKPIY